MKIFFRALIVMIPFWGFCAWAYIPTTANILKKTVRNNGNSAYQVDQEVQFQIGPQTLLVQERWIVEDGGGMRLEVRPSGGRAWSFDVLYSGNRRFVWDGSAVKSHPLSSEFAESFFYYRSLQDYLQRLVNLNFLPSRALRSESSTGSASTTNYNPEPWVRLGRVGGSIAFVLGDPESLATLWIEQDSFHLKRLRFTSEAEVIVDEYREQTPQLTFPQVRRYLWNQHSVLVRTTKVSPITIGPKTREALSPQSLSGGGEPNLPEEPLVREFYSRFR